MQVNKINNTNFTGVIPVNIYLKSHNAQTLFDYNPVRNEDIIRKCCNKIVKIMAGPIKDNPKHESALKSLSELDGDYSLKRATYGYCVKGSDAFGNVIDEAPSDYFKIIFDDLGDAFITTGRESQDLSQRGINIGRAKRKYNKTGKAEFLAQYNAALEDYGNCIKQILSNKANRIKITRNPLGKGPFVEETSMRVYVDEILNKTGTREKVQYEIADILV